MSLEEFGIWVSVFAAFGGASVFGWLITSLRRLYTKRRDPMRAMSQSEVQSRKIPLSFYFLVCISAITLYFPPIIVAKLSSGTGPQGLQGVPGEQGPQGTSGAVPTEALSKIDNLEKTVAELQKSLVEERNRSNSYSKLISIDKLEQCLVMAENARSTLKSLNASSLGEASGDVSQQLETRYRHVYDIRVLQNAKPEDIADKCLGSNNKIEKTKVSDEQLDNPVPGEPADRPNSIRKYRRTYWKMRYDEQYATAIIDEIKQQGASLRRSLVE